MTHLSGSEFLKYYQSLYSTITGLPTINRPEEMLENISSLFRNRHPTEEEWASIAELGRTVWGEESDTIKYFSNLMLAALPEVLRSRLATIPVGTLPIFDFNAASIRIPSGEHVVVVNSGLFILLHNVSSLWVATKSFPDSPTEVSFNEATQSVFLNVLFHLTGQEIFATEPITTDSYKKREWIGGLSQNAVNFALAHEYGHILLGHTEASSIRELRLSSNEGLPPLQLLERSHEQEFDADIAGTDLAFGFSIGNHDGLVLMSVLGTEVLLHIMQLCEALLPNRECIVSHPPAVERRRALLRYWRDGYYSEQFRENQTKLRAIRRDLGWFFRAVRIVGRRVIDEWDTQLYT